MIRYEVIGKKHPFDSSRKIYLEAFLVLEAASPEHIHVEQVHPATNFVSRQAAYWQQKVTLDNGEVLDMILDNEQAYFTDGEYIRYDIFTDSYKKFDKENVGDNLRLVHEDPLPRKYQKRKTYAS